MSRICRSRLSLRSVNNCAALFSSSRRIDSFSGTWKEDPSQSVDPVNPNKVLTYRRNPDGSMTQTFVWGADKGDSSRGQWVNDRGTDFRGTACV